MNALSWLLAISTLIILIVKAMNLHEMNVCRQEAWLKSTEYLTRSLLTSPVQDREWHLRCQLVLSKDNDQIFWQRLPSMKKHNFHIELSGQL
jgi:hypothetical protein